MNEKSRSQGFVFMELKWISRELSFFSNRSRDRVQQVVPIFELQNYLAYSPSIVNQIRKWTASQCVRRASPLISLLVAIDEYEKGKVIISSRNSSGIFDSAYPLFHIKFFLSYTLIADNIKLKDGNLYV